MYITEGERLRANARLYLAMHYGWGTVRTMFYQFDIDAYNLLMDISKDELEEQENSFSTVYEDVNVKILKKGFKPKGEKENA